ncbi:hypothetical protein [Helcococcus kunzii]|uniref:hypothetical protein n=1 Tax=Helcococcus kunzii TaxID=40091 RepID=UPI0021A5C7CB|nr:hypothetical protein [Helcococcus kunzii]MCT1796955.1 hypothetical protein [Helcococcus kunzii]MCT1988487.1 hypothetical protein [Helcococcus kunzii]
MKKELKGFKFRLLTSFYFIDKLGYESILEKGLEYTRINFLVDGTPNFLEINDETEFIDDLMNIKVNEWNNKGFENLTEDAEHWKLYIYYDDIEIKTGGIGRYPKEFMDILHRKYGLKYSVLDKDVKKRGVIIKHKWDIKRTKIVPYDDIEGFL